MKHAEKLPSRGASSSYHPPAHRLSHAIAKAPPPRKIRIIHVLAPEVIKTEARHFRELVQRLTGKPPPQKGSCAASLAASTGAGDASPPTSVSSCDTAGDEGLGAGAAAGIEMKVVKEEAETSSSPSGEEGGGFLRALELDGYAADGFYQGLEDFLFTSCDDMDGGFNF